MAQIKRETANICRIEDIQTGDFVKADGWTPSYFITKLGKISRVNIIGVLVSKEQDGLILDDGTGSILLRSFENNTFEKINVGSFVIVIGRPRMYAEQRYIMPEIIKELNPNWAEFRKIQIESSFKEEKESQKESRVVVTEQPQAAQANPFQTIVNFIKDLDNGPGAPVDEVIKRSGFSNASELVRKLIEEGEIFEIKPGMLKILE